MDLNHGRNSSEGVHFQPTVDLRTTRVIGVGTRVGRANPRSAIELAARAAGDWWRSGLGLQLAISLPPTVFSLADGRLDELIARTLGLSGLPANALRLGVTEDTLTGEHEGASETLERLGELGASVSIDRFGTGLFSIRQLVRLPIDELRIDRSLINDLANEENRTIVRSTIHLAHQTGLRVVAEGVDAKETWQRLRGMGADRAQGLLISRSLPAREVPAWLATWNQRARELRSTRRAARRMARADAKRARADAATLA